jgi:hypothetical protein
MLDLKEGVSGMCARFCHINLGFQCTEDAGHRWEDREFQFSLDMRKVVDPNVVKS